MPTQLSGHLHPLINQLADQIITIWHETLAIFPYALPADLGYVEGRLEGERLVIENQCFQAPPFRKLHLELAQAGQNLDILHCVMFPDPHYNLPIFGCDLVGGRGQISAAIVDLSPVSGTLPVGYLADLEAWGSRRTAFSQPRALPDWGDIFSPYCLFIRPGNSGEEADFLALITDYLRLHCHQAQQATPVEDPSPIYAGQQHYCERQQQNDRTRRVLEKSFGAAWADRYMTTVLFDLPTLDAN